MIAGVLSRLMAEAGLGISSERSRDLLEELRESSRRLGGPCEGGCEDLAPTSRSKTRPEPCGEFLFTHRGADGFEQLFTEEEESKGALDTLAFCSLALRLLSARTVGLIDEIDSSLHPNYVEELVWLFRDLLTNPNQSQLIFTTHDVSLITRTGADRRVLDQDQIWLVEKDVSGASTIYPVSSVQQSRWDEGFGRNYLHGVYGASLRPHFHEVFAHHVRLLSRSG